MTSTRVLDVSGFTTYPEMNGRYTVTGKYSGKPKYSNGTFTLQYANGHNQSSQDADRWHLCRKGQVLGYRRHPDVTVARYCYLGRMPCRDECDCVVAGTGVY